MALQELYLGVWAWPGPGWLLRNHQPPPSWFFLAQRGLCEQQRAGVRHASELVWSGSILTQLSLLSLLFIILLLGWFLKHLSHPVALLTSGSCHALVTLRAATVGSTHAAWVMVAWGPCCCTEPGRRGTGDKAEDAACSIASLGAALVYLMVRLQGLYCTVLESPEEMTPA